MDLDVVVDVSHISPLPITAVFVGFWVGGILGGVIAIPLAAVVQVALLRSQAQKS